MNEKNLNSNQFKFFLLEIIIDLLSFGNLSINDGFLNTFNLNYKNNQNEEISSTSFSSKNNTSNFFNLNTNNNSNSNNNISLSTYLKDIIIDKMSYKKYCPNKIILFCGKNDFYESGTETQKNNIYFPNIVYNINNKNIHLIFSGNENNFVINKENNKIYSWGNNEYNKCGITINNNSEKNIIKIPTLISFFKKNKEQIIQIISKDTKSTLFLTKNNNIYIIGFNYITNEYCDIPTLLNINQYLNENGEKIIKIEGGEEFYILFSNMGNVYSFGKYNYGQLGFDINNLNHINSEYISTPTQIIELNSINNIIDINAGKNHCFAINTLNEVYCWGFSNCGQLGLNFCKETKGNDENCIISKPIINKYLSDIKIKEIYSGNNFSIFKNEKSELLTCGNNDKIQLGIIDNLKVSNNMTTHCNDFILPTQIESFINFKVLKVSCGENHCLGIIEDEISKIINLWSWGDNTYGQLGLGKNIKKNYPKPINSLFEYIEHIPIDISCGNNHSLILIEKKGAKEIVNNLKNIIEQYGINF